MLFLAPCPHPSNYTCFNRKCVPHNVLCDEKDDCGDGSDEDTYHADCICMFLFQVRSIEK